MSGDVLPSIGRYQLLRKLATGGMAEVYLARVSGPMGFEKQVVLKRVLPHLAEEENFVTMFLSEARLVAQLNHPNVVQVFDFGEHLGVWFLVMELIDGPNLRALLKRAAEGKEWLPAPLVARVISLACEGLAYAHDFVEPRTGQPLGLVHRDVSPDNILLSRTGAVKVVDFGIAKVANQLHFTRTGMVRGKFSYMPPEQLQGEPLDRRADVYALGMCLYELLAGRRPFDTAVEAVVVRAVLYEDFVKASAFRPDLPPALQAILDRALAKPREARYPDCRAMQADLERYIASTGQPVSQHDVAQLVQRLAGPSPWAGPVPPQQVVPVELLTPSTVDRLVQVPPTPATVSQVVPPAGPWDTTELGQPAFVPPAAWGPAPSMSPPRPAPPTSTAASPVPSAVAGPPPLPTDPSWTAAAPARRSPWGLVAAGVGAVVVGAVVTALVVSPGEAPPPVTVVVQPARVEPAPPPASAPVADLAPSAAAAAPPPDDALPPPAPAPPPAPPPLGGKRVAPPPRGPVAPVEFRVRPFGTIYLDGKRVGDTPMGPVSVTVGRHALRIVNQELGREEKRTIDVPAKGLTVRHSFGD